MRRLKPRPAGFTLIELLVVISIIAILVALLLPAVQKVREAASRSQCQNNLKQIALACHNYHDIAKSLPQSWYGNVGAGTTPYGATSASWSWLVSLLPYIDQENIYRMANMGATLNGVPQTPLTVQFNGAYVISQPLPIFRCPSDPDFGTVVFTDRADLGTSSLFPVPVAITNYKGVCGANWMWGSALWNPGWLGLNFVGLNAFLPENGMANGNGILWRSTGTNNKKYNLNGIRDGTSNTFLIGEDIPSHSYYCGSWAYANNTSGTCAIYPNATAPNLLQFPLWDWTDNYSFASGHPNGVQFAMADASVHFIQNNIGVTVYWYLATANGGETVVLPN